MAAQEVTQGGQVVVAFCVMIKAISCSLFPHFLEMEPAFKLRRALFSLGLSCFSRCYINLHIEVDSLVLVHILKQISSCPWSVLTEASSKVIV